MKNFILRLVCLAMILGIFGFYNQVTGDRMVKEAAAKAKAEKAMEEADVSVGGGYKDGTYTGSAQGYGGTVTMEAVVEDGKLASLTAVAHGGEDGTYWAMCDGVIGQLMDSQGTQADTVSGATFSSAAIINATIEALNQAL